MSNSLRLHGLYSPWNSPGQNTGVGSLSLLQGNPPNPGIEPRSPTLQADSLPAKPPGKPKSTGVGSLSHLRWIFPTQKSNRDLLHCRWILYSRDQDHVKCSKNMTKYSAVCTFPKGFHVQNSGFVCVSVLNPEK